MSFDNHPDTVCHPCSACSTNMSASQEHSPDNLLYTRELCASTSKATGTVVRSDFVFRLLMLFGGFVSAFATQQVLGWAWGTP